MDSTRGSSGVSDLDLPEGILDDEEEDDAYENDNQFSELGGSQGSEVNFKRSSRFEEHFGDGKSTATGNRTGSRKSSRTGRTEMLFEHEDEERPRSTCRTREPAMTSRTEYQTSNKQIEVSEEIKGLFRFIDNYKPRDLEISTILKPFIPDFIPAVGGVDEFIKVPRPDGRPDYLGLKVLDERGPKQSDAAVVNLQLRASSMQSSLHPIQVASVENAEKNPKKLDAWIQSIKELHKSKPPPSVVYSKPMPSIEKLMQEWPVETENVLQSIELPTEKLDLDIGTFADACCTILDIPVYKSRVESLHLMFSLYLELKSKFSFSEEWPSRLRFPPS